MRIRTHFGLSSLAARNIRAIREGKKAPRKGYGRIGRRELAHVLNSEGQPPGDPPFDDAFVKGFSYDEEDLKWWDEQSVVRLEQAQGPGKPAKNLPIDDLLSVCQAFEDVSLFDLLLPDPDDLHFSKISMALFGFDATPAMLGFLRMRAELGRSLEYHPEVARVTIPLEVAYMALLVEQPEEASAKYAEKNRLKREKIGRLLAQKEPQPTEDQIGQWMSDYWDVVVTKLGWTKGGN